MKGTLMPFKLFIESPPACCLPHALTSPMFSLHFSLGIWRENPKMRSHGGDFPNALKEH